MHCFHLHGPRSALFVAPARAVRVLPAVDASDVSARGAAAPALQYGVATNHAKF